MGILKEKITLTVVIIMSIAALMLVMNENIFLSKADILKHPKMYAYHLLGAAESSINH